MNVIGLDISRAGAALTAVGCAGCREGVRHGERTAPELLFDPVDGCALCGLRPGDHPVQVHGLGHLHDGRRGACCGAVNDCLRPMARLGYVEPLAELRAAREGARFRDGRRIAAFDGSTGQPITHLVEAICRCGSKALSTPQRVEGARCGACMLQDAGTTVPAGPREG